MSNEWDIEAQHTTQNKIWQELKEKYECMDNMLKDMDEQFKKLENVPVAVISAWNKEHDNANQTLFRLRNMMARTPVLPE